MRSKKTNLFLCLLMVAAVFTVAVPRNVSAEVTVTEEWVARYNGPGNDYDGTFAMALDSAGNVYVTGLSWDLGMDSDYATIKYDPNGNELWAARYKGPENSYDRPYDIAVDSQGNVYVTGLSVSETNGDYATVAYDSSNGEQLWVARYNGPGNGYDWARAIAVDSAGNVYVTGYSYGGHPWEGGTSSDYATVAYDSSNGEQLWAKIYNGPGNYVDYAEDIAVDSAGNVYVTGYSYGGHPWEGGTSSDYATVAYDSSGNELWVARYNGPGNSGDGGFAMAVDSNGNVFVTGLSWYLGMDSDYATVAYDSIGNELWVSRYNGPGNHEDYPWDLAIDDSTGNIYVTGYSHSGTDYSSRDYATVAYDSIGNELWVARYNGPGNGMDWAFAVALDSSGNIYVAGSSFGSGPQNDFATIAYDSSGNELWVARYNGPGNSGDGGFAMAVDSNGNVFVTGPSTGSGSGVDYATIKYTTNELPVADAGFDQTVFVGETVPLDGSGSYDSDGTIVSYEWDFGDETQGSGETTTHLYDSVGIYTVTLTVTDDNGATDSDTVIITIQTPTEATQEVLEYIQEMELQNGMNESLSSKLENAIDSMDNDQDTAAVNQLNAFINQVEAQRGKKLSDEEADALIAAAQWIIDNLSGE